MEEWRNGRWREGWKKADGRVGAKEGAKEGGIDDELYGGREGYRWSPVKQGNVSV